MAENQRQDQQHPPWYRLSVEDALKTVESRPEGLSTGEAKGRLVSHGPNQIGEEEGTPAWKIALNQLNNPIIYVLFAALAITLSIQSWPDAIVIGLVIVINTVIGFFQEYKAQNAIQALMGMVETQSTVRRDGQEQNIDGASIVPGDIVLVESGDVIPADLRLIEATGLQVNEAALTGESVPVGKTPDAMADADDDLRAADQENMAFQGTAVTAGSAVGVVVATGEDTRVGNIAQDIRGAEETQAPLMRRIARLSKLISVIIVIVSGITFGLGLAVGKDVTEMLLTSVAVAVGCVPGGLPIAVTVALAVSVRRMARRHSIIRQLPAVETLGSTTVILSDKTGTLTQNQMTVQQIAAGGALFCVSGTGLSPEGKILRATPGQQESDEEGSDQQAAEVAEGSPLYYALLCGALNNEGELAPVDARKGDENDQHSAHDKKDDEEQEASSAAESQGDPMELALLVSAEKAGLDRGALQEKYPRRDSVPFSSERKFSATIHDNGDGDTLVLVKGAPERILDMCAHHLKEDGETAEIDRDFLRERAEELAADGLRMLAMAIGRGSDAAETVKSDEPGGLTFVGMQGLLDPPREEAIDAVAKCRRAGIRVLMVTGDHATTAAAIAARLGIVDLEEGQMPDTRTGKEIAGMSDEDLDRTLGSVSVYARVNPDQKLRLVRRLQQQGAIVAVTGDGVNDAPALKSGDLGAAMGQTGTEVAKEASDMVITDDNFASIYAAVEEGRTAFRNIRMAAFFLLSPAGGEVLAILASIVMRLPLPLLPAQILWVNVLTSSIQDKALAVESGEQSLFRRPPRPPSEGIFNRNLAERFIVIGILFGAGVLGVFYYYYKTMGDLDYARTAAMTMFVVFQMFHVFNCRSENDPVFSKSLFSNKFLFISTTGALALHAAALYIPWTQYLLDAVPLGWQTWLVIGAIGLTTFAANEAHKAYRRARGDDSGGASGSGGDVRDEQHASREEADKFRRLREAVQ